MGARTKAVAQRLHAKRRAKERYGLVLNRNDAKALVRLIQTGKGKHLEKQSLRVSVWELALRGQTVRVVYDKIRKTIVTFLPNEDQGALHEE